MWTDLCLGASVVMAAFIVAIVAPIVANAMVNAERERPHRVTAAETACPNDEIGRASCRERVSSPV